MNLNPLITRQTIFRNTKQENKLNPQTEAEPSWKLAFNKAYSEAAGREVKVIVSNVDDYIIDSKKFGGSLLADQIKYLFHDFHFDPILAERKLPLCFNNKYNITSLLSLCKNILPSTISELLSDYGYDKNISRTKWIRTTGLDYNVFKQLVTRLNLSTLVVSTMFSTNPFLPEYYGKHLLIEIPHYTLLYDKEEIAPYIKKGSSDGGTIVDPCDWLQREPESRMDLSTDFREWFTVGALNYRTSEVKVLTCDEDNIYWNYQVELADVSYRLLLQKVRIVEGKNTIVLLDDSTFFTYSNFFGDNRDDEFVLKCLKEPEFKSFLSGSFSSSDYVLLIIIKKIENVQESCITYCDILTKLEIDISNNPSKGHSKQLKDLSRDLKRFKSHPQSLKLILKKLDQFEIFKKERTLAILLTSENDLDLCLSSIDTLIDRVSEADTQLFNTLSYKSNAFTVKLGIAGVVLSFLGFISSIFSFCSSYFGMNFKTFEQSTTHDVEYFWYFSSPIAGVFTVLIICLILCLFKWKEVSRKFKEAIGYVTTGLSLSLSYVNNIKAKLYTSRANPQILP